MPEILRLYRDDVSVSYGETQMVNKGHINSRIFELLLLISHQACAARLGADRGGHRAHGTDGGGTGTTLQP